MRIIIIGAGLSGLATAWHLLQADQSIELTLYDHAAIGQGNAGKILGLMHPYVGIKAQRSWEATAAQESAFELMSEHILHQGIFRPALSPQQEDVFFKQSQKYDDIEWWTADQAEDTFKGMKALPGLFIPEGIALSCSSYLESLWERCRVLGAKFEQKNIVKGTDLGAYDHLILATGAQTELHDTALSVVKGQIIELAWPKGLPPLPYSLSGGTQIIMHESGQSCFVGSTYEHHFEHQNPVPEIAIPLLRAKLAKFFPALCEAEILSYRAGLRASPPPPRHPIVKQISAKQSIITGMGSKGLLYHAYMGKLLTQQILITSQG